MKTIQDLNDFALTANEVLPLLKTSIQGRKTRGHKMSLYGIMCGWRHDLTLIKKELKQAKGIFVSTKGSIYNHAICFWNESRGEYHFLETDMDKLIEFLKTKTLVV